MILHPTHLDSFMTIANSFAFSVNRHIDFALGLIFEEAMFRSAIHEFVSPIMSPSKQIALLIIVATGNESYSMEAFSHFVLKQQSMDGWGLRAQHRLRDMWSSISSTGLGFSSNSIFKLACGHT
jgi:hypothetical protein